MWCRSICKPLCLKRVLPEPFVRCVKQHHALLPAVAAGRLKLRSSVLTSLLSGSQAAGGGGKGGKNKGGKNKGSKPAPRPTKAKAAETSQPAESPALKKPEVNADNGGTEFDAEAADSQTPVGAQG